MTKAATVVRYNDQLAEAYGKVCELERTGQEVLAFRHRQLDESKRRLHQGPARHVPAGQGDPERRSAARRMPRRPLQARFRHARLGCRTTRPSGAARRTSGAIALRKTSAAGSKPRSRLSPDGEPQLSYEDVDTSLIPPRPRLYGLVGAEMIEEVWKERQAAKTPATGGNGNGQAAGSTKVAIEK